MKPRQIVTKPHIRGCLIREWIWPTYKTLYGLDRIGRCRRGVWSSFLVFRCNDPECGGVMIMPWHEAAEALGLNEKTEGK